MIIPIHRDKNTIRINTDFASAVPEFAAVLEDERLGTTLLAYVVYSLDVAEDNIYQNLPEEIRKVEVAESLKIDKALLNGPKVLAAMKKYKIFVEQNAGYQFKSAYISGMQKISKYVKSKSDLNDEDAKEFSAVMKEMPTILKGKAEIEKQGTREESKGLVRGKKTLTLNERSAAN